MQSVTATRTKARARQNHLKPHQLNQQHKQLITSQKMSSQTFLITGAGRGLGKGLVAALLQRPNTTVVAALRDPSSDNTKDLSGLAAANGSKLFIVKIDSESDNDPFEAVTKLQNEHRVTIIDGVIANAAIVPPPAPTSTASVNECRRSFQVNAIAPLLLFQAIWPLLQKSKTPRFVGISSCLATISKMEDWTWPMVGYGTTKAAMNYIVRKMHFENENLVAFVVHPG